MGKLLLDSGVVDVTTLNLSRFVGGQSGQNT